VVTVRRPIVLGFLAGLGFILATGLVNIVTFLVETTFWSYFE
jgi:hypothetical protein